MTRKFAAFLLLACSVTAPSYAAIKYEFHQITRSDNSKGAPGTDVTARVVIDGTRSRVDYLAGSPYGTGSYIIADQRLVKVVQPLKKTFTELDGENPRDAIIANSGRIVVTNAKIDVRKLPDHPVIAGYPTDHFRVDSSYDMTVNVGGVPLTQTVHSTVEKWTTTSFAEANEYIAATSAKTGNVELDKLIDAETTSVPGLPLKQVTTITTSNDSSRVSNSALKMAPRRQQSSEMTVTSIETTVPDAALFVVPADFRKADLKEEKEGAGVHILDMQPSGGQQP